MKTRGLGYLAAVMIILISVAWSWAGAPVAVSPAEVIGQNCPTFSWSLTDGAVSYRIEVYEQRTTDLLAHEVMSSIERPARIKEIVAPALTWTPSTDECLGSGIRYMWYVRGANKDGDGQWSEGMRFQVEPSMLSNEHREAINGAVREYLASEAGKAALSNAVRSSGASGVPVTVLNSSGVNKAVADAVSAKIAESGPADAPTTGLTIDQNGYVGIGTTTPTAMLQVAGPGSFTDSTTNGTGVEGRANIGTNAWGVYGISGDGVGVMGRSVSTTGYGGRFENLGGGKAIGAMVNTTEVMTVDATGVHAGPGMAPTPIAHGFFDSGAGARLSGSSNITCAWDSGSSRYACTIAGEDYSYWAYTVSVTPTSQVVPATNSLSNQLLVTFYNLSGVAVKPAGGFSVTVFKQ